MKLNKKLLVFVLSLVMLVGMLTVAAFAADGEAEGIAFTYQVGDGEVQSVASLGSPEADGKNFVDLLDSLYNIKIVMYSDIVLPSGVRFGTTKDYTDAKNKVVQIPDGCGDVDWDLNGHTVTVAANAQPLPMIAWREGQGAQTTNVLHYPGNANFKLYSSVEGGEYINLSAYPIFGINKYSVPSYLLGTNDKDVYGGDNLKITSTKAITAAYETTEGGPAGYSLYVNGGIYVHTGSATVFCVGNTVNIYNAKLFTTGKATTVIGTHNYSNTTLLVDNTDMVAKEPTTQMISMVSGGAGNLSTSLARKHAVSIKDIAFAGGTLTLSYLTVSFSVNGSIMTDTEENLAVAYPTVPEGASKHAFKIDAPAADGSVEEVTVYTYTTADQIYTVTYSGANVTKNYLVGKYFVPERITLDICVPVIDIDNGAAVLPLNWRDVPQEGILDASYGGKSLDAEIDFEGDKQSIALAFALWDLKEQKATVYAFADSKTIGADLAKALAAEGNAAELYVYRDITAPALTVAKDITLYLSDKTLTLGGALTVNAKLDVTGGVLLSAAEKPFVLNGSIALDGTKVYLSSAKVVFDVATVNSETVASNDATDGSENVGSGTVALKDVNIYNLVSASMAADAVTVSINGAKLAGVVLGKNVTVAGGTILGAAGTFDSCVYADGITKDIKVNNNSETVTVLGQAYEIVFAEVVSDVAEDIITVKYMYRDIERGSDLYLIGSIPSFYKEFAKGYYFEYVGVEALTEDVEVECIFHADASKLKAQIYLTDALNLVFYLQVEAEGVISTLKLNNVEIALASLEQLQMADGLFYEIPVSFETFADALGDYKISVDFNNDGDVLSAELTISFDEYLAEVLKTAETKDAKLAYAVAEYVVALVEYFDYDFEYSDVRMKNLGRINNLLADYAMYKVELPALPEETDFASDYIVGALLVADEKVTFAFHVADGFDGSIVINDNKVALAKPFEGFDRTYALYEVSFADLNDPISVAVSDAEDTVVEELTYTLADYIAGVIAQNEGVAADYAKALWKLASIAG